MRASLLVLVAGCGRVGFGEAASPDADAQLDTGVVQLSHRGTAPCVRSGDGRVACWGGNDFGQVGVGRISVAEPPTILPLANITSLATGENGAFAVDADGVLWGWGANDNGQLGLGTQTSGELAPVQIPVPEPVVSVATGQFHTCAITAARGELYCWGHNSCGQLGTGDIVDALSPRLVPGLQDLAHVTVSDTQTCVVDRQGGAACVGAPISGSGTCPDPRLTPTPPVGLPTVVDLEGGCHLSMCAADATGAAWCWGDDVAGVLGDGLSTPQPDPSRVAVVSGIVKIGTGYDVSCALNDDNDVFCWGSNRNGHLGVGNMTLNQSNTALQVQLDAGAVDELETGCSSVCVRSGGDVTCWGKNDVSIVDSTTTDAYLPVPRLDLPF